MRLYFIYGAQGRDFAEKIIGNLVNYSTFCEACGPGCLKCRISYRSFVDDIVGFHEISGGLPTFIEEPEKYLPEDMPECDIVIAIGLHPDILKSLPLISEKTKAKGVIVPIENSSISYSTLKSISCPLGLQKQIEPDLEELGVEYAFPKPFCSLEETGKPVIDAFIKRYKIGRPILEVEVETVGGEEKIANATTIRSAPCGSTWYVAQQIRWHDAEGRDLEDAISKAHHAYPCTAGMEIDPVLKDTILHKAGYMIREAVKEAISKAKIKKIRTIETTVKV